MVPHLTLMVILFFYEANRNSFGMGSFSSVNNSEAKVSVKMIRVDSLYEKFGKKLML